jgi:hypothetical protein
VTRKPSFDKVPKTPATSQYLASISPSTWHWNRAVAP